MADNQETNQPAAKRKFNPGGIAIGIGIGVALGVAMDNMAVWIPIGAVFGIVLGKLMARRS